MSKELGSIKETVALSPREALDSAEALLTEQGYEVTERADASVTAVRRKRRRMFGHSLQNLTVTAVSQPEGGVRITLRGDDREGVRDRQVEWSGWAESLPKLGRDQPGRKATARGAAIPETTEARAEESRAPSGEAGGWATVAAWER